MKPQEAPEYQEVARAQADDCDAPKLTVDQLTTVASLPCEIHGCDGDKPACEDDEIRDLARDEQCVPCYAAGEMDYRWERPK